MSFVPNGPASGARTLAEPNAAHGFGLRRVFANLGHLLGGKAGAGLISLVYLVIVARTLGARDYGVLILVNAYVVLLGSIVAFSGFHGLVRYGAIALEDGDHRRLARIVRLMTLIECACGAAAIVIAMLLVPLIGPRLGWSEDAMRFAIPYSIAVVGTVRATPQGLLQIAGRFDLIGLHQIVSPLVRLVGAVTVWLCGGGLVGFLAIWLLSSIAECVAMWIFGLYAWRRMETGERLIGGWRGVAAENQGFTRFILVTNFDITLRELTPNLLPLTVGWMLGPAAAGLLSLAQRASNVLQQPAVLLSQASYAVLADLVARGDSQGLRHTVWKSAGIATLIAVPIVLVLALFGGKLLTLLGGGTFAGGTALLVLIAIGRAAALGASPIAAGLTAMGLPQQSVTVALVTNIAFYPLLPLLLLWMGANGAGWHALFQNMIALGLLGLFFNRALRAYND